MPDRIDSTDRGSAEQRGSSIEMPALPKTLPDDVDSLKALLIESRSRAEQAIEHARTQAQQEIERNRREFEQRLEAILEQLRLARRRFFGVSSERHIGQDRLFDEAELLAAQPADDDDDAKGEAEDPADSGAGGVSAKTTIKRRASACRCRQSCRE